MADYSVSDIAILRKNDRAASSDEDEAPLRPASARAPRKTTVAKTPSKIPKQKKDVDVDERFRQVTAVLLLLASVLLLLALVSYTPLDQANADVRVRDLVGLVTNDVTIAAKADTTENWLGLLGAFFSNFLINATVGYVTLAVPLLMALWGVTIFAARDYAKMIRVTLYALLAMTLVASVFGTIQMVGWMAHPDHEWSGNVGSFIATILSSLLGTAGSFLILLSAIFITALYALDLNVRTALGWAVAAANRMKEQAATTRETITAKLGERENDSQTGAAPVPAPAPSAAAAPASERTEDNEPAQMVRRMRNEPPAAVPGTPAPTPVASEPAAAAPRKTARAETPRTYSEPKIRRVDTPPLPNLAPPPPSPTVVDHSPAPVEEPEVPAGRIRNPNKVNLDVSMLTGEPPPPVVSTPAAERPRAEVKITHGEPSAPPPSPLRATRLTVNVQEGETDADLETEDDGEIIEELVDEQINYVPPSVDLLLPQNEQADVNNDELKENARILQEKLATFNIQIEDLTVTPGPVVTLYEFVPAAGIKIAQIESLADDIALALKARGIRIIAPIPGKGTVGVEIPNHKPAMVRIRSVLNTNRFREATFRLPLALGKTTVGEVFCDDLTKMPHLLIAGSTGSGKSVGINSILASLLYGKQPNELKFVIIDPKKIELSQYKALRAHFLAGCPDIDEEIITNPQNAVLALKSLEMEMDRRYDILAKVGQRNIFDYNTKVDEGKYADVTEFNHIKLPYIVLILDELADLMITAAKEVEEPIARLAQLARAIGIHLIVATQRPSVDVITGVIKANFPARIAYQVASKIDSRTILDMNGAEQLLGNGDMLYLPGGQPKPLRLQNAFISTEEVEAICEHIGNQAGFSRQYMLPSVIEKNKRGALAGGDQRDDLFDEAARLVVRHQQGSVSLLQRRLKVGYSRAARIVDELEMAGVVGPFDGSKARQVLLESEAELEAFL
jgi:S-DNA-T family DNA segregation ATPase FtsK/SpoIIIE